MMKRFKSGTKWFYWFTFAVAIITIYKILDNFTGISAWLSNLLKVLNPFIMAILMSYLLYIPCKKIEELFKKNKVLKKRARGLSVLTVYILAIIIITLLVNLLIPTLKDSIESLAKNIPSYYNRAIQFVEEIPENSIVSRETVKNAISQIEGIDITQIFTLDNITMYIEKAMGIASGVFNIFVTIIISIYILLERTSILTYFRKLSNAMFSKETYERLDRYFVNGNRIFFKYVSSQVVDAIIVSIIMTIALTIMKVNYALLLGVMIGIFNLIPFFGAIVAVALTGLITVFTGGFSQAIWVVVVLIILQQMDANILNPKIVGDALEISKILIIFSVTVAGAYFGILGMFLGVPIVATIKMMLDDYIENNKKETITS